MAIAKMKKFTLLTFHAHRQALLKELQQFEDVHFKQLRSEELVNADFMRQDFSPQQIARYESELDVVKFSVAKIAPHVAKPKGLRSLTTPPISMNFEAFDRYLDTFDYKSVCERVKAADERINQLKSETTRLKTENESLKSWLKLDVSAEQLESLRTVDHLIGTVVKTEAESFKASVEEQFDCVYLELLGVMKDDMAMLALIPKAMQDEVFGAMKELGFSKAGISFRDIPSELIASNMDRLQKLAQQQEEAVDIIRAQVDDYDRLQVVADYFRTVLEREKACQNFLAMDTVVLMEGWVPQEESARFLAIITKVCGNEYYLDEQDVEKNCEEVPIKLKNNKIVAAFEDVTSMYALPKYSEIDPTPLFMPFYFLFFGIMVGDLGYGLILFAGTGLALKFCHLKAGMKKFIQFFFCLSFGVIGAGFLTGSIFGFTFFAPMAVRDPAGAVIGHKAILDSQLDIASMLVMAVAVGVIQVIFGLMVKGYLLVRDGHVLDAIFDSVFWIVTLLGGIGFLLGTTGMVSGTALAVCKWSFFGGIVGLALTQGRGSATIGGKIGTSLWEVYGISSYVGDLVSYTRIVALSLSGSYIAYSFIKMASILPEGFMRAVFGFIIIFLGQTLNLGLGLLGAYVHTCRLQYVEFFGKFYEGGGKPFTPFECKNDFIQITK